MVITDRGEIVEVYQTQDPLKGNEPRDPFVVAYTSYGDEVKGTYFSNEVFPC